MKRLQTAHSKVRRAFLRRCAITGGALAIAGQVPRLMAETVMVEDSPPEPATRGYRETNHVRTYYRTTRI